MSRQLVVVAVALLAGGCVIDPPQSMASRFDVAWELTGGATCEDAGAQRVRLQSTLRSGLVPELFSDEFACEDGGGQTRPLEAGPYDVQLIALSADDQTVGLSELRSGIELLDKVVVELEPFAIDTSSP